MTCNREAPSVEAASNKWADTVRFVGVAWYGDDSSFQGFISEHGLTFPQVSDDAGDVFSRFGVPSQPALVVISPDGEVQQLFGAVDEALLDDILTRATG
ncbi:MAG: redoxin domain-containing protein [Actinobacteria bacterium]|nr:redoxin domain-containing protein [Actinomycetota bacterium]